MYLDVLAEYDPCIFRDGALFHRGKDSREEIGLLVALHHKDPAHKWELRIIRREGR